MSVRVTMLGVADPLSAPDAASELAHRWLVWDAWASGKRRVDLHPLVLSVEAHENAVRIAREAGSLVSRAADRAASDVVERARYRLHDDVERLAAASRVAEDRGSLARVDLLLGEDGDFIACENNADCPGGHNEAMALPRLARQAGFRDGQNPTDVVTRLADRLVALSGGAGSPRGAIAITYATAWAEDLQVAALVERLVAERGGRVLRVPPTAPKADGTGVAVRGERVSVLYRFFPLEYMAEQRNVEALARAIENRELAMFSSGAAIHAQSKLAMARAFAAEPENARGVFPETMAFADVDRGAIAGEPHAWVLKRDLSRVGEHVVVGAITPAAEFDAALAEISEAERTGEVWVAQRFVPQRLVPTPWGPRHLTLGVYLLDGAFAGYFARLSATSAHARANLHGSLCSHEALVLPVFVDDEGCRVAA